MLILAKRETLHPKVPAAHRLSFLTMPETFEQKQRRSARDKQRRAEKKALEAAKKVRKRKYDREYQQAKRAKEAKRDEQNMSDNNNSNTQPKQLVAADSSSPFSFQPMSPAAQVFALMLDKKEASLMRCAAELEKHRSDEAQFRVEVDRQGEAFLGLLSPSPGLLSPTPKKPAV